MTQSQNKTRPTSGPWVIKKIPTDLNKGYGYGVGPKFAWWVAATCNTVDDAQEANARLIAAAGTSATACYALGYDGTKCVENVADIVRLLEDALLTLQCDADGCKMLPTIHAIKTARIKSIENILSNLKN